MTEGCLLQGCAKFGIIKFDLGWPRGVKGQRQNFDSKYLENGDRCEVGPREALICKTHGLSNATVRFYLGRPSEVKNQGHTFDMKCVKNGNSYDVGQNGDYINCPWASLWMTFNDYRSRSQSLNSKYFENGDRYEVGPQGRLFWKQPFAFD